MGKWEMVRLGDVLIPQAKSRVKASDGVSKGTYRFFTSSNTQTKWIDEADYCVPSLIFGTGGNASVHFCNELFSTSTDCLVFSGIETRLKAIFLYLKSHIYLLEEGFKGAGLKHISKGYILEIQIPLPPLTVQQKIADVLDRANTLIERRKAQIEKLELLIKSQFIEMFGDPVTNPMGWKKDPMGHHLSLLTDFSANGSYEYLDSNVIMRDYPDYAWMVRTIDLEKQDFSKDVKYINKEAYEILGKSKLFGGEIIMNKIGSAGKIYLMPILKFPASLGRNAFMFRYKDNIKPMFIYFLLTSKYGEKEIQQHVRGAVTKTITKDAVRSIPIIVPPLALQTRFAAFVERVEVQKVKMKQGLNLMEVEYKSLMQKCFNGEM